MRLQMLHKQMDAFRLCLDEQRFYDAHEALEEIWFARRFEDDDEMKLLKGLINAAVSFELYKRNRPLQSKKVWKNYLKYRPLLRKINPTSLNKYHQLCRHIETIHNNKHDLLK